MKIISDYTIYCTSEQTKRALELGASLEFISMFRYGDNSLPKFVHKNRWNRDEFCYCPTAEQMIGWLEVQEGIRCVEVTESFGWHYRVKKKHDDVENWIQGTCQTRPEATLAGIDAALEYLTNNKK